MRTNIKKSAIDLTELAIGVLILGIIVTIGATILNNVATTQITSSDTYAVNGEVITTVTGTGEVLTTGWVKSVDHVYNATAGGLEIQASGNYTVSINEFGRATIKSITAGSYNNTNWDVNYTVYNTSDPRFSLPSNASIGLGEYGNWFKILVIVGIAAVILALIFMAFGRAGGGTSDAGVGY